jgi:hypothetical protein
MKIFLIVLAFCASAYLWLHCFAQWFAGPVITGSLPPQVIALRVFAAATTFCRILAIFKILPATIAAWAAAIIYLGASWKFNVDWVFRDDLRFMFWTAVFLTITTLLPRTNPQGARDESV